MAEKIDTKKKKAVDVEDNNSDGDDEKDTGEDCGLSDSLEKLSIGPEKKLLLEKPSLGPEKKLLLEKPSLGPEKKLLILCLGGMLFHRVHRRERQKYPKTRGPEATYGNFLVYKRPFCEDFLKFCFERFEVGLWSSAKEWNTDDALKPVMGELRKKLAFVWDQDRCTDSGFMTLENKKKPIFLKELKKIWENKDSSLPWKKGAYTSANTLMIETEPYKALLNPPNTAIFMNEYHADQAKDTALGPKGDLQNYLDEVAAADNVPTYVKEHPFGTPAITPSHSGWSHYCKIIRRFEKSEE